jgi:hypothetical protein
LAFIVQISLSNRWAGRATHIGERERNISINHSDLPYTLTVKSTITQTCLGIRVTLWNCTFSNTIGISVYFCPIISPTGFHTSSCKVNQKISVATKSHEAGEHRTIAKHVCMDIIPATVLNETLYTK